MITISKKGVASGDPLELIKLCYVLNKDRFVKEFDKVRVKINCDDYNTILKSLNALCQICKAKADVEGKIKYNGQPLMFDTMKIVDSINSREYTMEEKNSIQQYLVA